MSLEKQIIIIISISILIIGIINIGKKFFSKQTLILLGFCILAGSAANKNNPYFNIDKVLLAIPVCFAAGLGVLYKNKFFHSINERILHLISLIYLYTIYLNIYKSEITIQLIILLIPFMIVLFYSISLKTLSKYEKILLYISNIYFIIFIDFFNLKRITLFEFPNGLPTHLDESLVISIFFISGILFYILIYIINILFAIPNPRKEESEEELKSRVEEYSTFFTSKVNEKQASPIITIIITLLSIFFIFTNVNYKYISHSYITEITLLIIISFLGIKNTFKRTFF